MYRLHIIHDRDNTTLVADNEHGEILYNGTVQGNIGDIIRDALNSTKHDWYATEVLLYAER